MKIKEIIEILDAQVCCGEDRLEQEINYAFASDMMSDVLAYLKDQGLLLTGLCNPQVVRTADMLDIKCIVIVRGKAPTMDMLEIAKKRGIVIIMSKLFLYDCCGLLYKNGLRTGNSKA